MFFFTFWSLLYKLQNKHFHKRITRQPTVFFIFENCQNSITKNLRDGRLTIIRFYKCKTTEYHVLPATHVGLLSFFVTLKFCRKQVSKLRWCFIIHWIRHLKFHGQDNCLFYNHFPETSDCFFAKRVILYNVAKKVWIKESPRKRGQNIIFLPKIVLCI